MDQVYRLALRTTLHVGSTGVGHEGTLNYMPADTLYGAFFTTWAWQGNASEVKDRREAFASGNPPFLLTSGFPYAGSVRLYPRPEVDAPVTEAVRKDLGKRLRKIAHVSEGILRRWIGGELLDDTLTKEGSGCAVLNLIQSDHVWVTSDERAAIAATLELPSDEPSALEIWGEEVVPHVTVGRADNKANLFHTGRVHYAPGCGLWFGVRWRDPQARRWVDDALHLMSDSGIGGLRSTGHGRFEWQRDDPPALDEPAAGDYAVLLSRLAPTATQMNALTAERSRYRLVNVGGWCGNDGEAPRKRPSVRLVGEGSVVMWSAEPLGKLVDVNPSKPEDALPHPVDRYGYGLGLRFGG